MDYSRRNICMSRKTPRLHPSMSEEATQGSVSIRQDNCPTRRTRGRGSSTWPTIIGHSHWAARRYAYKPNVYRRQSQMDTFPRLDPPGMDETRQHKIGPNMGQLTSTHTASIAADRPVIRPKRTPERQPTGVTQPRTTAKQSPEGTHSASAQGHLTDIPNTVRQSP